MQELALAHAPKQVVSIKGGSSIKKMVVIGYKFATNDMAFCL
jgi:hypothetical protein